MTLFALLALVIVLCAIAVALPAVLIGRAALAILKCNRNRKG